MKRLVVSVCIFLGVGTSTYAQFNGSYVGKDQQWLEGIPREPIVPGRFWASPMFDPQLAGILQRTLDSMRATGGIRGVSVALRIPGQGLWLGVSGASTLMPDSIRPDMLFCIGSITKNHIAALIMKLQEDGLLDIDDSLHEYFPPFAYIDTNITLRQLLNHTSGLYDYFNDNAGFRDTLAQHIDPTRLYTPEELLARVGPPPMPPGQSYSYCNTNYVLLGMIIKQVTGSRVVDQLRTRFWNPLGFHRTFLEVEDTLTGPIAHGWHSGVDWHSWPRTAMYSACWTAGAIFSTAEEHSRWTEALYGGEVVTPASLSEMRTCVDMHGWYKGGRYDGMGLGVVRSDIAGRLFYGHTGNIYGYNASSYHLPEPGISASFQYNVTSFYSLSIKLISLEDRMLATCLRAFPPPPLALPGMLAFSGAVDSGKVYVLDTANAATSQRGAYIYDELVGAAQHPITRELYAIVRNRIRDEAFSLELVRMNAATGLCNSDATLSLSSTTPITGMAFDSSGVLYVAAGGGGGLYRVNLSTGLVSWMTTVGAPIAGLAFHPQTHELWAAVRPSVGWNNGIFKIELPSGDTVHVGQTGLGQSTYDLTFDPEGVLYGLTGPTSQRLIKINTATGQGTVVGATPPLDIKAIEFIDEGPLFALTPSGLSFAQTIVGDSLEKTATVKNYGNGTLTVSSIACDNPVDFSVTPASGILAPGESLIVQIVFHPADTGFTAGHVVLHHDDRGSPDTVSLAGRGVVPVLSVTVGQSWNIISVPHLPADFQRTAVFPSSISQAFRYQPGIVYAPRDTLTNGEGYWLKFPAAASVPMIGVPLNVDSAVVVTGWNLIGSISGSVPVASIGSIPGGIVTSPFYTYGTAGYEQASTIAPGKGYWVRADQPGLLVLSSSPLAMARIRIVPTDEVPPAPPGEVTAESEVEKPREFALSQNYPNPFNPTTTIEYNIGGVVALSGANFSGVEGRTSTNVRLTVFDVLGREVVTLVNEVKEPGTYTVQWNASGVSSGVYFYRIKAGDFMQMKRMILAK
jgi:CubicO group peptidase (beta-lactamase class C family)